MPEKVTSDMVFGFALPNVYELKIIQAEHFEELLLYLNFLKLSGAQ